MGDWTEEVEEKLGKGNRILFSRRNEALHDLADKIYAKGRRELIVWAFLCAEECVRKLERRYPGEERPRRALEICGAWAAGEIKMPDAKSAIPDAHALAKEISSAEDAALCHAVGQGCAVVHTPAHALGLPVYELTAIVRGYNGKNYRAAVEKKVGGYIARLREAEEKAGEPGRAWAGFLVRGG